MLCTRGGGVSDGALATKRSSMPRMSMVHLGSNNLENAGCFCGRGTNGSA